ncbi:hypothetical protein DFQ01_12861 [Paenibacillus cellulosilyticus]|uniref:Uncharacterized protein n=1 Tax=Paenibacillus cellulosilyticus TaxID=375489 RepID=A0A2V2YPP7_9BACL|nr:hypothetical protein DFQ01_12861 [Paenibacillus cellulosilyticus]
MSRRGEERRGEERRGADRRCNRHPISGNVKFRDYDYHQNNKLPRD